MELRGEINYYLVQVKPDPIPAGGLLANHATGIIIDCSD